jgi:hypothetical protein
MAKEYVVTYRITATFEGEEKIRSTSENHAMAELRDRLESGELKLKMTPDGETNIVVGINRDAMGSGGND